MNARDPSQTAADAASTDAPATDAPASAFPRTIVLVGLMGAGKSCIARRLAARLDVAFSDADQEVERAAGMTIPEIFESYGEASFRDCERRVIARLLRMPAHVLATGGGAFMNDATRALIKARATSVWLRADLDLLVRRTAKRNTRPLLQQGDPRETLRELMAKRDPIYAEADVTVDSVDGPPEATVQRVEAAVAEHVARNQVGPPEPLENDGCIRPPSEGTGH